jgi:hypothetical protein
MATPRLCGRLPSQRFAAGLADRDVLVVDVAHLADGGHAVDVHLAHFARGQLDLAVLGFLGHELGRTAGRAHHLPALALAQLDVVDHRAGRDHLQRQRIARQDVGRVAREQRHADLEAFGRQDVALLAVTVVQERQVGRAVGIVFDRRHERGNTGLVAPEVHDAVAPLVAATHEADARAALVVAAAGALDGLRERLLRGALGELLEGQHGHEAPAGRRRFELLERHR